MREPLLDTDTISFFLKGYPKVVKEVEKTFDKYGYLNISIMTYYEIMNGLFFKDAKRQLKDFEELVLSCKVLLIDTDIALKAAKIYADLRVDNQIIGHSDVLIGATALYHNLKIVTNNQGHFSRIPNLELDNWL
jgi:tRNA(fMet)-specific endonuclease VapC